MKIKKGDVLSTRIEYVRGSTDSGISRNSVSELYEVTLIVEEIIQSIGSSGKSPKTLTRYTLSNFIGGGEHFIYGGLLDGFELATDLDYERFIDRWLGYFLENNELSGILNKK